MLRALLRFCTRALPGAGEHDKRDCVHEINACNFVPGREKNAEYRCEFIRRRDRRRALATVNASLRHQFSLFLCAMEK